MSALHFADFAGESACTRTGDVITLSGTKMTNARTFASAMADANIKFDDGDVTPVGVVDGDGDSAVWWATYANGGGTLTRVSTESSEGTLGTTGLYVYAVPSGEWLSDLENTRASLPGTAFPVAADFPSAAIPDGTEFYHQTRKIKYVYEQAWVPLQGFGAITLYVEDGESGDGFDTGADAAGTIQSALDQIPVSYAGDVTINVEAGTFSDDFTAGSQANVGNYTLTIQGALTAEETNTVDSGVQGTGATRCELTATGDFAGDAYGGLLAHNSGTDDYRVIDSHTDDVLTLCGATTSAAPSGTYNVYDWGTIISGEVEINALANKIILKNLSFTGAVALYGTQLEVIQCEFSTANGPWIWSGTVEFLDSSFHPTSNGIRQQDGYITISRCLVLATGNRCVWTQAGAVVLTKGTVIDGGAVGGLITGSTSFGSTYSSEGDGYVFIRNCAKGIYATANSVVESTANNQYSNNTADEDPAGADQHGYID